MTDFDDALVRELPRLARLARRITRDDDHARDLLHDVVERALAKRGTFAGQGTLGAWLNSIMRNTAIDGHKRARRSPPMAPLEQLGDPPVEAHQEQALVCADILREIDALPRGRREALRLEMSGEGAQSARAERMGIPLATYRTRVHRARLDMRERIEINDDEQL
ncbi:RNA polymerase sigma factor [Salinarimonas chemoclinalis]|uniref:RNA polymerase sigma factor n=1 Tax=Salinarimonas chemoclinalis TaxID=3241599 RepID=UPI0035564EEE